MVTFQESIMFISGLWFLSGLLVGWNVLPQPVWVKKLYQLVIDKIKGIGTKSS